MEYTWYIPTINLIGVTVPDVSIRRRRGPGRRGRGEAAPSGEAASWLHWKGKVCALRLSAYILPAASRRDAARLGETQAQ
jgi:hypothetical protein